MVGAVPRREVEEANGAPLADERALVTEQLRRLLADADPNSMTEEAFWARQFDAGLAWVQFPRGAGGLAVARGWQHLVQERIAAAGWSAANRDRNIVGIGLAAATLVEHAPAALCDRLLRPLFTAEEICCQLFSEPGAGSDLAGLSTSAMRDGDTWVVNGQKVWTTQAHVARWGILLARSDPSMPKHRGLTFFLLDMQTPGIEVRPLYEMTGEAEFNEVFLRDVVVPDSMRIGDVGAGWRVATTTLMNERVTVGRRTTGRGEGPIAAAVRRARRRGLAGPWRDALMRLWVEAEVQRLTAIRADESTRRGAPGPEGSVAKLHWAELNQRITNFTLNALSAEGMLLPDGYEFRRPVHSSVHTSSTHKGFLRARANTIEGGTSEIMRNIMAERVLGLRGEPRDDKDTPWREVIRDASTWERRHGR